MCERYGSKKAKARAETESRRRETAEGIPGPEAGNLDESRPARPDGLRENSKTAISAGGTWTCQNEERVIPAVGWKRNYIYRNAPRRKATESRAHIVADCQVYKAECG